MQYVFAVLSLGFLIVVHEGGHYFVARACGMRIERFSIGFGPGIFKRRSKKTGTTFQIAPIPFGGFVEIRGMNIAEEVDPEDRFAYPNRPAWQRFITIFAGPATNYLSAIVIGFTLFSLHGVESSWRWFGVASIKEGYDADGKLEIGDRLLAIDDKPILAEGDYVSPTTFQHIHGDPNDSLVGRINARHGAAVKLTIERDGHPIDVTVQPKLAKDDLGNDALRDGKPYYVLGITPTAQPDFVDVGVLDAAAAALRYPVDKTKESLAGIYGIIAGKEKADPGGPVRIGSELAKAWRLGWVSGVELLMLLSVYLGLVNLFPLPALDGGRLVFLGYELVTRRRPNPRIEAMVHMGGIMVLGVVMILVTLHDFHLF